MKKTQVLAVTLATLLTIPIVLEAKELPLSHNHKVLLTHSKAINLPKLNKQQLTEEDHINDTGRLPYRFAVPTVHQVDIARANNWQKVGDKDALTLKVEGEDSSSLSFGFSNMFLPKGAKLYIYSQDYSQVLGPYTEEDNKKDGSLWTPIIEGNSAIIELSVPHQQRPFVDLSLEQINQGYRSINKRDGLKSGSCNNDVVCPEANNWRDEIRSVVHYSFTTSQGSFVCTGTLVNNTAGDRKPYVLTANHCVSQASVARTMVFYWNYETSVCAGTPDGSRSQNQSGATLRATWDTSDVTLVELDAMPSASFNVHWAGWDNNPVAPSSAVAIHHPAGDEKRISFENDALTITNYLSNTVNNNAHYLRVGAWDDGTTEGGSSGSGIWNSDKRVVGTLTGGTASCEAPNDPDWYGRMSSHWEGGGTNASQLKAWLDPNNTGATTLDGTDACTAPTVSFTINPSSTEVGQVVNFTSTVSGGAGGPYSYQWDFNGDGVIDSTEASPTYTYQSVYVGNVNLTVTEGSCNANRTSAIVVTHAGGNTAPTASVASSSITVNENASVSLDASSSSDPNGDSLTYSWSQTSGANVNLSGASSSVASFTAPAVSTATSLGFEVTVTDTFGATSTAQVSVTVNDVPAPTPPPSSGGGGAIHWLLISMLGGLFIWRRKALGDIS